MAPTRLSSVELACCFTEQLHVEFTLQNIVIMELLSFAIGKELGLIYSYILSLKELDCRK
jgi:hypothetical protein